ncbi:ELM1/GtrOC1 family putative glycosyltransferase [Micavibrio aeruginosavorus]|uniref:ELM1/GtrOC1 family putative glycosyltransferase n=1 Tax=Micavibrio aeruginosavorus TaxID=349221 RepID=UPI003F4A8907
MSDVWDANTAKSITGPAPGAANDNDSAPIGGLKTKFSIALTRCMARFNRDNRDAYAESIMRHATVHLNNSDGKPRVWIYIGPDHMDRGDTHGTIGIGRCIADHLGADRLQIDQDMLDRTFPNTKDLKKRLSALAKIHGNPDIILGTRSREAVAYLPKAPTMHVTAINENHTKKLSDPLLREIAPNHITPDLLQEAERDLRRRHRKLNAPIIAVFLASASIFEHKHALQKLSKLCRHNDKTIVYFCASHRTSEKQQRSLVSAFKKALANDNIGDRVRIISSNREQNASKFNPYKGLLSIADHAVLLGQSVSMLSEAIANGRPLYLSQGDHYARIIYQELQKAGYIKIIEDMDDTLALRKEHYPPLNATNAVADDIIACFRLAARARSISSQARKKTFDCCDPQFTDNIMRAVLKL